MNAIIELAKQLGSLAIWITFGVFVVWFIAQRGIKEGIKIVETSRAGRLHEIEVASRALEVLKDINDGSVSGEDAAQIRNWIFSNIISDKKEVQPNSLPGYSPINLYAGMVDPNRSITALIASAICMIVLMVMFMLKYPYSTISMHGISATNQAFGIPPKNLNWIVFPIMCLLSFVFNCFIGKQTYLRFIVYDILVTFTVIVVSAISVNI